MPFDDAAAEARVNDAKVRVLQHIHATVGEYIPDVVDWGEGLSAELDRFAEAVSVEVFRALGALCIDTADEIEYGPNSSKGAPDA